MAMQKLIQLQRPRSTEFISIGIGNKRVLPYPTRVADGSTYHDQYFDQYLIGITQLQLLQENFPEQKYFIPSSVDIGYLFKVREPFWVGTGTVVLRAGKDGYADKRVRYKDGAKVELRTPVVAHHGESWISAENGNALVITDYQKLREYKEIDVFTETGWKYIRGFDEKELGAPTDFGDEPKEKYGNARAYVNPNLLIAPLARGIWVLDFREGLFCSDLDRCAEDPLWRFPLGSEATADNKQLLNEQLLALRKKVMTIPDISAKQILDYVRDLDSEFEEFSKSLLSE